MFTAKQYRAKAAEYGEFLNVPRSPIEISEFRNLQSINHKVDERAEVLMTCGDSPAKCPTPLI